MTMHESILRIVNLSNRHIWVNTRSEKTIFRQVQSPDVWFFDLGIYNWIMENITKLCGSNLCSVHHGIPKMSFINSRRLTHYCNHHSTTRYLQIVITISTIYFSQKLSRNSLYLTNILTNVTLEVMKKFELHIAHKQSHVANQKVICPWVAASTKSSVKRTSIINHAKHLCT
jgi:hypothetical protein